MIKLITVTMPDFDTAYAILKVAGLEYDISEYNNFIYKVRQVCCMYRREWNTGVYGKSVARLSCDEISHVDISKNNFDSYYTIPMRVYKILAKHEQG